MPIRAGGKLLRLGDIATIRRGFEDPPSVLVRSRGAEAVLLGVVLAKGENGLALGQRLDAFVDAETARLPLGITFLAMPLMGINLDRITLGALIITLGLLVDDAIISVEMMLVKIAEPQTVAARTNEEVRGGTRFFPGLPHGVQSCPRYPCFYGRAVSCNGELHHHHLTPNRYRLGVLVCGLRDGARGSGRFCMCHAAVAQSPEAVRFVGADRNLTHCSTYPARDIHSGWAGAVGVITMAMIGKVRRMRFRQNKSVREISRATSLSRNTVRKYLRIGTAEVPKYRRPAVPTKLTPFVEVVQQALLADARRPKKERRTAKALHAQLVAQGYAGGYTRLTDYIRAWRAEQGGAGSGDAYVPLSFALGEAFQFDWSEEALVIGGQYQRLQVAHLKLCASRAFWLVAYPSQGHEMLFDAHTRAFSALGGVARRGIYDNMKTAVDRVGRGKQRDVNLRFTTMCAHYLFDADFCNVASGWEKGVVEKNVQDSRRRIWLEARSAAQWRAVPGVARAAGQAQGGAVAARRRRPADGPGAGTGAGGRTGDGACSR